MAKKDMIWLYTRAHAAIGIKSSFGAMISASFGFSPNFDRNTTEDTMLMLVSKNKSPVKKLRTIMDRMSLLSIRNKRVLDATYGSYQYPPYLISCFSELTGAALFTSIIKDIIQLEKLCQKKTKNSLSKEEKMLFIAIVKEAEKIYKDAHMEYGELK